MKKIIGLGIILLFIQSCAPTRFVEPLKKNELSVGGSFGGPLLEFGLPIPVPITSVEVGYGLSDDVTGYGALHTSAALFGNLQLDLGCTYRFLKQKHYLPALSFSPSVNLIFDFNDRIAKAWPIMDVNAFWNYGNRKNYLYVGVNNYFELSSKSANDQPQSHHWIFSPQLGHVIKGKTQQWQLTTELKLLAPYVDNSYAFVPYSSILGTRGATAFFIGCRWKIGKE